MAQQVLKNRKAPLHNAKVILGNISLNVVFYF
ncbi:hypothetical protein CDSM653_02556 [Caldanaerobacter subterraneus subsp. pacificus DSM 12653]|uniref:Uncharacterized protein n=1 Tax=Caldanaerobacter subterraneus subsp. pacificus DSM 12653 TaxID=391606 RepID=A0A0F5PJA2_9THEO|nr:hypothetical protein CDSM653_02556 [Caldanaerobacter subterraneus subsp. pacificus DSM 12653]